MAVIGQNSDGITLYANCSKAEAMKKIALIAAATSLMALAACSPKTPAQQNVIDTGDNAAAALDNTAENLDAMSDNATNTMVEKKLENAADNAHASADNAHEMGENAANAMKKGAANAMKKK